MPRPQRSLLAACALLGALALPGPAQASPRETVYFEAPTELLSARLRAPALNQIASLGAHAVRLVLYWRDVAPQPASSRRPSFDATNPALYAWGQYDAAVTAVRARGWSLLLTVSGPVPRWATALRRDSVTRPSPREFGQFMTAVGRHYGSRAQAFSIWNEPNEPRFLDPQFSAGQPASPRIYRGLFQAGVDGLRGAGVSAPVLLGETAPRGTGHVVAPLAFLRGALCLDSRYRRSPTCSALPAAGYAHHAYTTIVGPTFVPPNRDDVTIGVLSRLSRALDLAARAHAIPAHLPIYLTEFGIQSKPNPFLGVSLTNQAIFEEASERIAFDNPRVAAFSQYLLRDDPHISRPGSTPGSGLVGFQSGLELASGRPKPAYNGFRLPLAVRRSGHGVSLWGLVRPAGGPTTVQVLAYDGHHGRVVLSARTDALGHWTARSAYRRGRRWVVRWRSPSGALYAGAPISAL